MNKHLARTLLAIGTVWLTSVNLLHAGAENKQEHMDNALHYLQDAKQSPHPAELLHSAKKALEVARHNKGGFREVALGIVDKAIAEAQAGDQQKMIEKINAAIAEIHNGMAHAPGSR